MRDKWKLQTTFYNGQWIALVESFPILPTCLDDGGLWMDCSNVQSKCRNV